MSNFAFGYQNGGGGDSEQVTANKDKAEKNEQNIAVLKMESLIGDNSSIHDMVNGWSDDFENTDRINTGITTAIHSKSREILTNDSLLLSSIAINTPEDGGTVADSSDNSHTISALGSTAPRVTGAKFGRKCINFDGIDDKITAPDSDDWDFGSGDFTIEFWLNMDDFTGVQTVVGQWVTGGNDNAWVCWFNGSNVFFSHTTDGTTFSSLQGNNLSFRGWRHFAIVKSGTSLTWYIDGINKGSTTNSDTIYASSQQLVIGDNGAGTSYMGGKLEDLRISNTARYIATFTPPTGPFVDDANTLLLLQSKDSDTGSTFTDSSGAHTLTGNGAVHKQIGKVISPTGFSTALEFDGSTSYYEVADNDAFHLTDEDFQVDLWINERSASGVSFYLGQWGSGQRGWHFQRNANDLIFIYSTDGTALSGTLTASAAFSVDTWIHLRAVRNGNDLKLFVDGVEEDSLDVTGVAFHDSTLPLVMGRNDGTNYLDGFLDGVRIIKNDYINDGAFTPQETEYGPENVVIRSASVTSESEPTSSVFTLLGDLGTNTPGADITIEMFKDGGTSEVVGELEKISNYDSSLEVFGCVPVELAGSGTGMVYELESIGNKRFSIEAIGFQWSL